MADQETYHRGPAVWALWKQFLETAIGSASEAPTVFHSRIKKFLDLDREPEFDRDGNALYAFGDGDAPGKGTEREFTLLDLHCLAIAVDMNDAGFKQSEVVHFLKHVRSTLARVHRIIMTGPDVIRRIPRPASEHPELPKNRSPNDAIVPDWRVFMMVKRMEFTGRLVGPSRKNLPDVKPFLFEPDFCFGGDDLLVSLNAQMWPYRKSYIAEIAQPARLLARWLPKAPEIRRGRQ